MALTWTADELELAAIEAAKKIARDGSSAERMAACALLMDTARQERWRLDAMDSLRKQLSTPGGALVVLREHGVTLEMLKAHVAEHGEPPAPEPRGLNSAAACKPRGY